MYKQELGGQSWTKYDLPLMLDDHKAGVFFASHQWSGKIQYFTLHLMALDLVIRTLQCAGDLSQSLFVM